MNAYNSFAEFVASFPPETIWRYWLPDGEDANYEAIDSTITLPDGDILIGFYEPQAEVKYVTYHKLSEIELARSERDEEE